MLKKPNLGIASEYALIAALVSISALAAVDAGYFAVGGLCFISSLICCRRLGMLIEPRQSA